MGLFYRKCDFSSKNYFKEEAKQSLHPDYHYDLDPYSTFNPVKQKDPSEMTFSEKAHLALDGLGLVPVVGEIADAANAVWYLSEGNYTDAALSGISMIPVAGDAIGKGGKVIRYGAKYGDTAYAIAKNSFKYGGEASNIGKRSGKIVQKSSKVDSAKAIKKAVDGGDKTKNLLKQGGTYDEIHKNRLPNQETHHMPANSVSPLSRGRGPAINMDEANHRKTASWGPSKEARRYRELQGSLVKRGKFDEAFLMDVDDLQRKFGSYYDKDILDAMTALPYKIKK